MPDICRAWMLDPIEFHHDFEVMLLGADGLVEVRDRAAEIWHSADPAWSAYVELLDVDPEHWRCECEDAHLVEWYRVLMAPYLIPTPSLACTDSVRRGLPQLGWHMAEARRLARGRELLTLAERHLDDAVVERLRLRFSWGTKGWLDHDDLTMALDRMRRLDRGVFRHQQDLVPMVENAFHVFEAAAAKPDHVMLTVTD